MSDDVEYCDACHYEQEGCRCDRERLKRQKLALRALTINLARDLDDAREQVATLTAERDADVERLTKERNTECVRTDKARAAQTRAYLVADTLQAEVERLTHRTQSLETERDHLAEQVLEASKEIGTLTKERDGSVTRANLALGIMRGEVDRLSKDRNALHGVLAELTDFLNGGDYLVDDEDLDALWERAVAVLNDEGGA